jgi:hypothetical protein
VTSAIIVCTHRLPAGLRALRWAADEARRQALPLRVITPEPGHARSSGHSTFADVLATVRAAVPGLPVPEGTTHESLPATLRRLSRTPPRWSCRPRCPTSPRSWPTHTARSLTSRSEVPETQRRRRIDWWGVKRMWSTSLPKPGWRALSCVVLRQVEQRIGRAAKSTLHSMACRISGPGPLASVPMAPSPTSRGRPGCLRLASTSAVLGTGWLDTAR